MLAKEKARANGPIPNAVLADGAESKASESESQVAGDLFARTKRTLNYDEDEFDWNTDDSIILREQRATAAYRNGLGELIIRQRGPWPDEDTFLYISPENEVAFLEGLVKRAREG
jgi:hypothetical protein